MDQIHHSPLENLLLSIRLADLPTLTPLSIRGINGSEFAMQCKTVRKGPLQERSPSHPGEQIDHVH